MKPASRPHVPVDADQWSVKSQQRLGYLSAPAYYEDKVFSCRACQCEAVFTAEQQKREYEVKKAYVLRQHVLCPSCFSVKHELQSEHEALELQYESDKVAFKRDVPALLRWIELLELLPTYGVRRNTARIRMLRELAEGAA
jgi:hypothetical protein